jgi:flavin reductase (DIM6/NTAB) family NADH-FMN oxidoreductase RutF
MPHTIRENGHGLPAGDVIESRHLRRSVGQFVTGVTVVTYESDGRPRGVTVNSFTSVSVDPPLILVSIARTARAAAGLRGSPLVVNVLAADQHDLARHFAGQHQDGLQIPWSGHHHPPRLRGAVAWIECRPYAEVDAGDHILFLSRVAAHRTLGREPLLFQTGEFRRVGDQVGTHPAMKAGLAAWLLVSQAQILAEDGVPTHEPITDPVSRRS